MSTAVEIDVDWAGLTAFERGQMYEQARQIENRFSPRDRSNVAGVFANLAISALVHDARTDGRGAISVVPKDVTAPDDQYRDDLGTVMAFDLMLEGDPWTLPGVRAAWAKVRRDLEEEREPNVWDSTERVSIRAVRKGGCSNTLTTVLQRSPPRPSRSEVLSVGARGLETEATGDSGPRQASACSGPSAGRDARRQRVEIRTPSYARARSPIAIAI